MTNQPCMTVVRTRMRGALLLAAGLAASAAVSGCATGSAPAAAVKGRTATPTAAPMGADRVRLLADADAIAGLIPGEDCEVDRSVDRSAVVDCCIELGDLDRAESFAARIENWRRGEALVRIGRSRLAGGDRAGAERCASRCLADAGGWRDWGIARVSAAAAGLWLALGDEPRARALLPTDGPELRSAFEAGRVEVVPAAQLSALADSFDAALVTQNLDVARGALDGYLRIMKRALASGDDAMLRRSRAAIEKGTPGLPFDLQVSMALAQAAALREAGRPDEARGAVERASATFDRAGFEARTMATVGVPIAEEEFRLGDRGAALKRIDALRAAFEARREEVTDLLRATTHRALAEGYLCCGEHGAAARCYAEALREGALNPNARPRANDLCETLVSMARSGFVPDAEMGRTIASIRSGLGDPW